MNYKFWLRLILWLVAIHSFMVGTTMLLIPISTLDFFGFEITERFFLSQGGIFHLVMGLAYVLAACMLNQSNSLVVFVILAKMIATVFLILYFLFDNALLVVLFSGIGDFIMGVLILLIYLGYRKQHLSQTRIHEE